MGMREYKTVPLPPLRTRKRRGRNPADEVAATIQQVIDAHAARGWTYLRAETIRAMESQGLLRGREEVAYTVLVFDRPARAAEMEEDLDLEPRAPAPARSERRAPMPAPRFEEERPAPAARAERPRAPEREPEHGLDGDLDRSIEAARMERRREAEPQPRRRPVMPEGDDRGGDAPVRRRPRPFDGAGGPQIESAPRRRIEPSGDELGARRPMRDRPRR